MPSLRGLKGFEECYFLPAYPCFSIFADACSGPVLSDTEKGKALLVLTNEALLEKYREEGGINGPTIRFDSARQLVCYLDVLPSNVIYVAFDPNGNGDVELAGELRKKLRASLEDA